jgi:hypothetical protein
VKVGKVAYLNCQCSEIQLAMFGFTAGWLSIVVKIAICLLITRKKLAKFFDLQQQQYPIASLLTFDL